MGKTKQPRTQQQAKHVLVDHNKEPLMLAFAYLAMWGHPPLDLESEILDDRLRHLAEALVMSK